MANDSWRRLSLEKLADKRTMNADAIIRNLENLSAKQMGHLARFRIDKFSDFNLIDAYVQRSNDEMHNVILEFAPFIFDSGGIESHLPLGVSVFVTESGVTVPAYTPKVQFVSQGIQVTCYTNFFVPTIAEKLALAFNEIEDPDYIERCRYDQYPEWHRFQFSNMKGSRGVDFKVYEDGKIVDERKVSGERAGIGPQ